MFQPAKVLHVVHGDLHLCISFSLTLDVDVLPKEKPVGIPAQYFPIHVSTCSIQKGSALLGGTLLSVMPLFKAEPLRFSTLARLPPRAYAPVDLVRHPSQLTL
jgi:hypothetical protein